MFYLEQDECAPASQALVLMVRGAINPIKFLLASFPTVTATSTQLIQHYMESN